MATPISQAFTELYTNTTLAAHFTKDGAVQIYREEIPKELLESKNIAQHFPIARINDISNEKSGYSSNRATFTESILQFSVWDSSYTKLDSISDKLDGIMPGMGYIEIFSYTTKDPDIDTPYLVKRYRYQKTV